MVVVGLWEWLHRNELYKGCRDNLEEGCINGLEEDHNDSVGMIQKKVALIVLKIY